MGDCRWALQTTVSRRNSLERAGYFAVPNAHLYTVLHGVRDPLVRVLLVGPFASERHSSYIPWVRWARYLAARRIESLRYDYRGIGESTGVFEDLSFDDWIEDISLLANWFQDRQPRVPLVLHGLQLGALLASKSFVTGVGDAILLWAPSANANEILRNTLKRHVFMENAFKYWQKRKPLSDYLRQLENGGSLEVSGYRWSTRLWRDSSRIELPALIENGSTSVVRRKRPTRIVTLNKHSAPLINGSTVEYEALHRDFNELFASNFDWIANAL
jgi:hypothetical protein